MPALLQSLREWYARNERPLPWRRSPRDAYRTWLAEIMAQQTSAETAGRYWHTFLKEWPTVEALAAADDADVMRGWAGLGYYARARNLLKTARIVATNGKEGFPRDPTSLKALPGIGPYTANAIAAIAFGAPLLAADTNISRIAARLFALHDRKAAVAALAAHVPADWPGVFNEALMDLGASICTARQPKCLSCPLAPHCAAYKEGREEAFPAPRAKPARPQRHGIAWWVERPGSNQSVEVALVRRPPKGLLGGMLALPGPEWNTADKPLALTGKRLGEVAHTFTHFHLTLTLCGLSPEELATKANLPVEWQPLEDIPAIGLPTLYRKAARLALGARKTRQEQTRQQTQQT